MLLRRVGHMGAGFADLPALALARSGDNSGVGVLLGQNVDDVALVMSVLRGRPALDVEAPDFARHGHALVRLALLTGNSGQRHGVPVANLLPIPSVPRGP